MIVTCPSCATRTSFTNALRAPGSVKITCRTCGHKWIEIDDPDPIVDAVAYRLSEAEPASHRIFGRARVQDAEEVDQDIERLVEKARIADEAFQARQHSRTVTLRNWGFFGVTVAAVLASFTAFPEIVVKAAPAAIKAYDAIGLDVNIYGLDIRNIKQQHAIVNGVRVLTIKGDVANISDDTKKLPWLRFGLKDSGAAEVYQWTLNTETRPLKPGEVTSFITRVAAPPEAAAHVEIRFARETEVAVQPQT
jgi:hypothetical protein